MKGRQISSGARTPLEFQIGCLEVARTEMVACEADRQAPAVVWCYPRDWSVRQKGVLW